MLIECKHCGAPLDVQSGARITKCKYCGTTSRVQSMKTVAQITPAGWRPPVEWRPPAHVRADSTKTLVYHASWAVRRLVRTVVMLATFFVVVPIVAVIVMAVLKQEEQSPEMVQAFAAAREAFDHARTQIETAKQGARVAGGTHLQGAGPDRVVERFRTALGGGKVRARRLVIHPGHASLVARAPTNAGHLDEYSLRGSTVGAPKPYRPTGLEKRDVESYLFDLDDVAIDKLPALGQQAIEELGYDQAAVSHAIIERNLPFGDDVVIRVYVSSPRDSGRIDYDATGKVQKVYR